MNKSFERSHQKKWSTLDWLNARQEFGLHHNRALRCIDSRVNPNRIASVAAWNPARMQNMILAVGPGTPASMLWRNGTDREDEMESEDEELPDEPRVFFASRSASGFGGIAADGGSVGSTENDASNEEETKEGEDDEGGDSQEGSDEMMMDPEQYINLLMQPQQQSELLSASTQDGGIDQNEDDEEEEEEEYAEDELNRLRREMSHGWNRDPTSNPAMRHGGCINTACWMDCNWHLSSSTTRQSQNSSSFVVNPLECPTQLITSGDDRLVKIWDVSDAMGMASPLEGGWDTYTPLAHHHRPDSQHKAWGSYYKKRKNSTVAGSVVHMATLVTGHRGNVFHVTPVNNMPGKFLTCAADGSLRLTDMQAQMSTLVKTLEDRSNFLFQSTMAFSHVMLTENTGLLCSEEGLHRFDLRISHREQEHESLLSGLGGCFASDYCKSCAVWSPHVRDAQQDKSTQWESNYVFAGGRSEEVALLDLRAVGGSRVVEFYKPRCLSNTKNVSVSGLDVSKDSRELLVSYESDQIYSFPILPHLSKGVVPTLDYIDMRANDTEKDAVHELAAYGGHLNRFTFLKNVKYAGPNDDYICTGSDSGCAWIYERKTGAAVSLLGADKCTCNGLMPHPSLPFFISYGIDSTAKLWRATQPVNPLTDSSASGRAKCAAEQPYKMSPVARSWHNVRRFIDKDAKPGMLPDFVASPFEAARSFRFAPRERTSTNGASSSIYGNGLRLLPSLLRRNRHECYRHAQRNSVGHRIDSPVEQPVTEFSHRVSLSRLRLQASQLGMVWNPNSPWAFRSPSDAVAGGKSVAICHPADSVPDNPSDWILLDGRMSAIGADWYQHSNFNLVEYKGLLKDTFEDDPFFLDVSSDEQVPPWLKDWELPLQEEVMKNEWMHPGVTEGVMRSRQWLIATINLVKDGGNEATKAGLITVAARRYDKVLNYCALLLMDHELSGKGFYNHLKCHDPYDFFGDDYYRADEEDDDEEEGDGIREGRKTSSKHPRWSPLVQTLITTRLNMAFLMLRPEFSDANEAVAQATHAVKLLEPFTMKDAKVDSSIMSLQAKAHFRLGCAKMEQGCYSEAIECFEASVQDSKNGIDGKPDKLVVKRLHEAKRRLKRKKERDMQKYKRALQKLDDGRKA